MTLVSKTVSGTKVIVFYSVPVRFYLKKWEKSGFIEFHDLGAQQIIYCPCISIYMTKLAVWRCEKKYTKPPRLFSNLQYSGLDLKQLCPTVSRNTGTRWFSLILRQLQRARSRSSDGVGQNPRAFLIPTLRETFISGVGRGIWWLPAVQIARQSPSCGADFHLHQPNDCSLRV